MKLSIIKIGGQTLDSPGNLDQFLKSFSLFKGIKILVHGGGKTATSIGHRMGIQERYMDGRRITDAKTLELVTMVYAGLINKRLVAKLQSLGCRSVGLCGADGGSLVAHKRPVQGIDFGFVGDLDLDLCDMDLVNFCLENHIVPVFSSLTYDPQGSLLNTNADTICSALGSKFSNQYEVDLYYCFDKEGVIDETDKVISSLNESDFEILSKKGIVSQGMIPKLTNSFNALKMGVSRVFILSAENLEKFDESKRFVGTKITL